MFTQAPMIIGGANGAIGAGLAAVAQAQGHPLYLVDMFEASPVVQGLLGDRAAFERLEITNVEAVDRSVASARARFGDVDQVIVVPAQGLGGADKELRDKGLFDKLYPTNVNGSLNLFDATRRHFSGAEILCVGFSSIVDMYGIQMGQSRYRLSKTVMRVMGQGITEEGDPKVASLTVAPGFVVSTMSKGISGMLVVSGAIQAAWFPEQSPLLRQGLAEFLKIEEAQLPKDPPAILKATLGEDLYAPVGKIMEEQLGPKVQKRLAIPGRGVVSRSIAAGKLTGGQGEAMERRLAEIALGIGMAVSPERFGEILLGAITSGNYNRVFELYGKTEPYDQGPIVEVFGRLPLDPPAKRVEVL